jgi:hypothetical protein
VPVWGFRGSICRCVSAGMPGTEPSQPGVAVILKGAILKTLKRLATDDSRCQVGVTATTKPGMWSVGPETVENLGNLKKAP